MEPTTDYENVEYGLITPDGRLFETDFYGHCSLADDLVMEGVLNENTPQDYFGSIHLADGEFDLIDFDCEYTLRVTQAQFNTMFDYMKARNDTFDFYKLEIIDEKPKTRAIRKRALNPFSQGART